MKRILIALLFLILGATLFAEGIAEVSVKIPIKVLILAKFEVGDLTGDTSGEAQLYYEKYLKGGCKEYTIENGFEDNTLYVKDGIALYITGIGKVNAAMSTLAVFNDIRFDFSDTYILSTGCAGSAVETTVMGDVFVISSVLDYDMGHHADIRDMKDKDGTTWFHDPAYDSTSSIKLNPTLVKKVFSLVKDVPIKTTEQTRRFMANTFDGASWATRDPHVMLGTTITGDNYWKGIHGHKNALLMVQTYGCPDPFVTTEMEEIGIAAAIQRIGKIDRLISIRGSVNMDVFMNGDTPESLWSVAVDLSTEGGNKETADIFDTSMHNIFDVGSTIIDAILDGKL